MKDARDMTDSFVVLGEARRPWIDVEALKTRFVGMSGELHPDRYHQADEATKAEAGRRYAAMNAAFQTLREARSRLLHLIEIETGSKPRDIQRIPPGTMDLFVEVGQLCRDVDAFLSKRAGVTAPMLKVGMFTEGMGWMEKLRALQGKVSAKESELEEELRRLNPNWESAPSVGESGRTAALPLGRLEDIYRVLSYSGRWSGQIQERIVQLAVA